MGIDDNRVCLISLSLRLLFCVSRFEVCSK